MFYFRKFHTFFLATSSSSFYKSLVKTQSLSVRRSKTFLKTTSLSRIRIFRPSKEKENWLEKSRVKFKKMEETTGWSNQEAPENEDSRNRDSTNVRENRRNEL